MSEPHLSYFGEEITMKKFKITALGMVSVFFVSFRLYADQSIEDTMPRVQEFAAKVCKTPHLEGERAEFTAEGKLSAGLPRFLPKILRLSGAANTAIHIDQESGILQGKVAEVIKSGLSCRSSVTKVLFEYLEKMDQNKYLNRKKVNLTSGSKSNVNINFGNQGKVSQTQYQKNVYVEQPSSAEIKFYNDQRALLEDKHPTHLIIYKAVNKMGHLVISIKNISKLTASDISVYAPDIMKTADVFGMPLPKDLAIGAQKSVEFTIGSDSSIQGALQTDGPAYKLVGFGLTNDLNKQCWSNDLSPGFFDVCRKLAGNRSYFLNIRGFPLSIYYRSVFSQREHLLSQVLVYMTQY
jgi:hypothetical protein